MGSYLQPAALADALGALALGGPGGSPWTVVAGATDYYPARVGRPVDEDVLDVCRLAGLRGVAAVTVEAPELPGGGWRIGALTTWTDLARSDLPPLFNGLRAAARAVGGRQVQNRATVAGNLCNASPAADGVPNLLALDAVVELASAGGVRRVPVAAFVTGNRRTVRSPDELVTGILVPAPLAGATARSSFRKLGSRAYLVISIAMAAAVVEVDAAGRIRQARIAVGACSEVAQRLAALEAEPHRVHAGRHDPGPRRGGGTSRRSPRSATSAGRRRIGGRRRSSSSAGRWATSSRERACGRFTVNGRAVMLEVDPMRRLADVLRDDLGLTGTKVGCNAGDCGACTVRLDGDQVAACLVPVAQADGAAVTTVEGLAGDDGELADLQRAFLDAGSAQCGVCTPGMLMAAGDLGAGSAPTAAEVEDALGGVLCRCTGYLKITEAVLAATGGGRRSGSTASSADVGGPMADAGAVMAAPPAGRAVGHRLPKVDGEARVRGTAVYGADERPGGFLALRAVRSPHARARFTIGDLTPLRDRFPGLVRVLTAADIPGQNRYGIYATGKDQPALAESEVRHRGEAVLALVGDETTIAAIDDRDVPIAWEPLDPLRGPGEALAAGAPLLHAASPGNVLVRGRVARGDVDAALDAAAAVAEVEVETTFVEHAYIEPEAGWAHRVGDRIELHVSTQTPYMDRDEVALILGLAPDRVRIVPTACGGGFGGKLDLGVHPLIATAAWLLDRPVRAVWTRPESMAASTKRHPASIRAAAGADADGRLTAVRFHGDFDTGAYASWGPTVAHRVPVHAMGPYEVGAVLATSRAVYTNNPPSGAFRGFGVPQAAIAHEALLDALADRLGIDRLEIRRRNALRVGSTTATGQVLAASAGLPACLDALRPHWERLRAEAAAHNSSAASGGPSSTGGPTTRRGVGIGAMWYGIGNTSMTNPSTMEVGLGRDGTVTLFSGAVDIGQGASTVLVQIAADALGVPATDVALVSGDTDRTADAGKSSASRQTFVSGNAARLAGADLRRQLLALAGVDDGAGGRISIEGGVVGVTGTGSPTRAVDLGALPETAGVDPATPCVLIGRGSFDPQTTPLDTDGQGQPYQTYAFGAQVALVEVDTELGTVRVLRVVAAHDVGRAVNPTQVEGQIHGGVAQGIGLALMEAFVPGRTENLHDYLIPTVGDVPPIDCLLIEDPEPSGPYGAKGVGEPALIPTAPAILSAIHDAVGVRITTLPATPDRILTALEAARGTA